MPDRTYGHLFGQRVPEDPAKCATPIFNGTYAVRQCKNNRGHGSNREYCKRHSKGSDPLSNLIDNYVTSLHEPKQSATRGLIDDFSLSAFGKTTEERARAIANGSPPVFCLSCTENHAPFVCLGKRHCNCVCDYTKRWEGQPPKGPEDAPETEPIES